MRAFNLSEACRLRARYAASAMVGEGGRSNNVSFYFFFKVQTNMLRSERMFASFKLARYIITVRQKARMVGNGKYMITTTSFKKTNKIC